MKILTVAGMILAGAATAGIYDAGLYSQVPLTDVSDANRATFIADAKAAGIDAVWISVVDFFEEEVRRKPVLDHLATEIRHFEAAGFAVGVWINAFGYGNERPFFKDSVKITTLEGKAKGGAVCPLDSKLRRALLDNVRDIARAGAKFILVDDDYVQSARSLIGCSCPRHLARVAAKCGRQRVTCDDVKAAFTGKPNAVRTAYLDVGGEVAMELARELRRAVDEVNPAVGMGLCASYTHWDVEGCDLLELVGAFAGKGRKVLRISGAPYWANSKLPGTGLADIIEFVRMQSAWTRGLDMTVFDENDPYPRKVARVPPWRCELYDKAIIADGHLARHKYMLCYGPDRAEPGYLEAHLANLPDDAALRRIFAGTEPYGVRVECPQHRLRTATLPTPFAGEHYITALYSQPAAAFELRRKGIPTRFDGPASSDEPLAVTIKASPEVYQIVHCDRKTGEYAVLLENMGGTAVDVQISVMGTVRVVESLHGNFSAVPGGLSLAQLPPHSYAAVRFLHRFALQRDRTACAAACAAGPRTTPEEFFTKHLDTSIPALSSIPAKMAAGDLAGAEKVFAGHVRATLRNDALNKDWLERKYEGKFLRALKRRAEEIMDYKLTSCETSHHFTDHKVDWDLNPTFNQYKEWTWQLSRHPFWTTLAEYYTATGDEKAVTVWIDMISSWFDQALVPEKAGPGATHCWRTIEAGIRMSGWSRQVAAFAKSPQVTDEFLTRYFISIWEHGWRLRNNSTNGNWLLMELHGLLRITLLYPFLNDAPEWKAYALNRLQEEFTRQVYPDGFQYELATGYHGVVISNYLGVFELYGQLGLEKPEFIRKGLEKMFEVYVRLATPNGGTPCLNDGGSMNVARWCRTATKLYPQRADFRWFATEGKEGAPPDYLSTVFPWAGAVVFRTSWAKDAVWGYMDGSPFGRGHQHEDKLNFVMHAYGKVMLTEGGNYMYDSSDCRKYVLSTRAHNTIRIDGFEQNRRRTYRWHDEDINVKADVEFSSSPARDRARSVYKDGYGPQQKPVTHDRTVLFLKEEPGLAPFFVVIDRLSAPNDRPHAFEIMWHLEECKLAIDGQNFTGDFGNGLGLAAATSDASAKITDMKGQHEPYFQGWMPIWVGGPHEQRPIPTPVVQGTFSGAKRIVTVLYPYRDGKNMLRGVKADSDPQSTSFTLVLADGTERILQ